MDDSNSQRVLLKARRRRTRSQSGSENPEKDNNIQILQNLKLNNSSTEETSLHEEVENLKNDPDISQSCHKVISCLSKELQLEKSKNEQIIKDMKELRDVVSVLQTELTTSKQWQASVYTQLQKMTEFNNEISKRMSELYSQPKKTSVKSAIKEQTAVVYGDSTSAKKLAQRRKLKTVKNAEELNNKTDSNCEEKNSNKEDDKASNNSIGKAGGDDVKDSDDVSISNIEETLREAAEAAISQSGYVYDETSGMYYNWNTKLYYDPNNKLYYDHENGIYYYYDQEKENYIFHSQVSVTKTEEPMNSNKCTEDELSEGEIRSDDSCNDDATVVDPCIRVIVVKSDSLDVGTLFIITCQGGSIGRDPSNNILLAEEMVSRQHAKIIYEKESKTFFIYDLKTQNGTFLNDERLSDPKTDSDPVEITHRDYIQVGETTMSFHIHVGNETCLDCEPGNIQAIVNDTNRNELKEDLNKQRKQEMKSMMKKYGLSKGYIPKKLIESIPDRAERRRQIVGSDPYENYEKPVEKASIHKEISEENIGHKMLAKMGWKSGEGLGKSQQGIAQPIGVDVHGKNTGLGFGKTSTIASKSSRRQDILNKTKERFEKADK